MNRKRVLHCIYTVISLAYVFSAGAAVPALDPVSSVRDAQTFVLKPGSREAIPVKPGQSPVEAIERYRRIENHSGSRREKTQQILARHDFNLRWADKGRYYTFGFDTGDTMAQWMEPLCYPTLVKRILIHNVDFTGTFEFFLHGSNYDGEVNSDSCADENGWVGVWEDTGWVAGNNECFSIPPLGEELWPRLGPGEGGWIVELGPENYGSWLEVDLEGAGYPDVLHATFFIDAAVIKTDPESWGIGARDEIQAPHHSFKYYTGPGTSGNPGWHIRSFGWEVYAVVEYTSECGWGFFFGPGCGLETVTDLGTTVSTAPREVCATFPELGIPTDLAQVWLYWEVEDEVDSVLMSQTGDLLYCAQVPGFSPGTEVLYWVGTVDTGGNLCYTQTFSYAVFYPVERDLFINNTMFPDWIDYYYLFGIPFLGAEWSHDVWDVATSGPATFEVLKNYRIVVEAQGGGPTACTQDLDRWLDYRTNAYIVAGDEFLGACYYGWSNTSVDIGPGEFAYDYLGLDTYYPDMNYSGSGDQSGVSRLLPVRGNLISGELFEFLGDSLLLNYDPGYEIGASNWLDGIDPAPEAEVTYLGLTGILDSTLLPSPSADTLVTAVYTELNSGSHTFFFGFDALSLNTMRVGSDSLHGTGYHWIGVYPEGPLALAVMWAEIFLFDLKTNDESPSLPGRFSLSQPYPNPFNPTTTIEFSVPRSGLVTLTVYDLLGREVETILNEPLTAGWHKIEWDASNVPSGIYFVRMHAANPSTGPGQGFIQTRKVTALK